MSSRVSRYCFTYRGNINPKMLKLLLASLAVNALVYSIPVEESVIEERIYGGKDTDIAQVPYQVGVYLFGTQVCGGAILSPSHVITSGTCIFILDESHYMIRAGSTSSVKGGVTVKARKFHTHPKFTPFEKDYDVGIIELATPLKLNDKTMKPIKLTTKEPSAGSVALVSGWGGTDDEGDRVTTLQSVELPIIERAKCEAAYKPHNITIYPRDICAHVSGKAVDVGDDGSPLVYKNELVGLVSMHYPWSGERLPSIFTNIAHPEITKFIKDIAKV